MSTSGIAADGAPAMAGKKEERIKLTEGHAVAASMSHLMKYQCIVHQDLCTKALEIDSINCHQSCKFHKVQGPESSQISVIP